MSEPLYAQDMAHLEKIIDEQMVKGRVVVVGSEVNAKRLGDVMAELAKQADQVVVASQELAEALAVKFEPRQGNLGRLIQSVMADTAYDWHPADDSWRGGSRGKGGKIKYQRNKKGKI